MELETTAERSASHGATKNRHLPSAKGQWVGVAANSASGRGSGRKVVERFQKELANHGVECRIAWTPLEREELLANSKDDERCRCIVACGGDGTVAALVNEYPHVPIAVLPAGTENLFAGHFRFSRRPEKVAEAVLRGNVAPLDLGLAGDRRFSLMAGFGFDADVVTRHHHCRIGGAGIMRPTNRAAYVEPVLRSSFTYRFHPLQIQIDDGNGGETLTGTTAFVFNLPRYALGLPFAPNARGDDGWLDLVVFRDPGPFRALRYLWLVLRGLHLRRDGVTHRLVRKVSISAEEPVPYQLDGDPGGVIRLDEPGGVGIEVVPHGIDVIVP